MINQVNVLDPLVPILKQCQSCLNVTKHRKSAVPSTITAETFNLSAFYNDSASVANAPYASLNAPYTSLTPWLSGHRRRCGLRLLPGLPRHLATVHSGHPAGRASPSGGACRVVGMTPLLNGRGHGCMATSEPPRCCATNIAHAVSHRLKARSCLLRRKGGRPHSLTDVRPSELGNINVQ